MGFDLFKNNLNLPKMYRMRFFFCGAILPSLESSHPLVATPGNAGCNAAALVFRSDHCLVYSSLTHFSTTMITTGYVPGCKGQMQRIDAFSVSSLCLASDSHYS